MSARFESLHALLVILPHRFEILDEPGNPGRNQAVEVARQRRQRGFEFGKVSGDLFVVAGASIPIG